MNYWWIFIGGGLGAASRWWVYNQWSSMDGFPYGTLSVNLLGCLLIGIASAQLIDHPKLVFLLVVGFLGGFTTFSTLGLDSFRMLQSGEYQKMIIYLLLNNVIGISLVIFGHKLATFWLK